MADITNDKLANMAVDKLWSLVNDNRLKGLDPYQAARAIGIGETTAKLVAERWDGPQVFPGNSGES